MENNDQLENLETTLRKLGFGALSSNNGRGSQESRIYPPAKVPTVLKYLALEQYHPGQSDKIIQKSIERICRTLKHKGYNSVFKLEGYGVDILPNLLSAAIDSFYKDGLITPFQVFTYTHFTKKNIGDVKSIFTIDLDRKRGLDIRKITAIRDAVEDGVSEIWEKSIKDMADIPNRKQANKMVMTEGSTRKKNKELRF